MKSDTTLLCVPIFVENAEQASQDMDRAIEAGADIVELRTDKLLDVWFVRDLILKKKNHVIVTSRSEGEGGFLQNEDDARAIFFAQIQQRPDVDYVYLDLELAVAHRHMQLLERPVILATHKGLEAKDEMETLLGATQRNVVKKIVWQARSILDNLDAFELLRQGQAQQRPTIALCMGEAGLLSRVLAKKFGAFLTFASLSEKEATAPGQVTVSDLKQLYRWDAIDSSTKVFGVVADPVRHSMSPAIHNAAFDATRLDDGTRFDGVYLPMLVKGDYPSFKAFMERFLAFPGLDLSGLSITIPHKEHALRYLRETGGEVEELAERIGAVNTLAIPKNGPLKGTNTDFAAILDSITAAMGIDRPGLRGVRVAVLGAGGTGRTAVAALAHYGADVKVCNRTHERAAALAGEFGATAATLDELRRTRCDVWINTTSVGMFPHVDASPLGDQPPPFGSSTVVFDTVYNPMETKLLKQARAAGAITISGVEMFVRQAAAQFSTWTGLPAPVEVMRRVIERRLGSG